MRHIVDEFYLVDNGKVGLFKGDLNDYYRFLREAGDEEKPSTRTTQTDTSSTSSGPSKAEQKRIRTLERELEKLRQKIKKANLRLGDPELYEPDKAEELERLIHRRDEWEAEAENFEAEWLELME